MLMMRLKRVGRKNNPAYRLVVVDKRTSVKSNKTIDLLGSYEPKLGRISINGEKAKHWLGKGVQPSDTVYNMLVTQKIIEGKKRNALPKKSPIIDEAKLKAEAEAKAAAEKAEADAKAAAEAAKLAEAEAAAAPAPEAEVVAETPAGDVEAPAPEEKAA
ncbi:MAG: 30S ribosomal protein S16 [Candidatus Pacebacteria bacterium]|jgi:small subunit ribosomal protein S16|nr:30S ribosomal protein S16 [Candidatus Paceibacterota bacterium]